MQIISITSVVSVASVASRRGPPLLDRGGPQLNRDRGLTVRNIHDFSHTEIAEIFNDAGRQYVKSGDRVGYVLRLQSLGITNTEIVENLVELDIERAEMFNQALAARRCCHSRAA